MSNTHGGQSGPTTLDSTLLPAAPGRGGYRRLERRPGEPHLVRRDLGGAPGTRLRPLCCFVHLSDLHVTDAQSPARAEFLDRLGDEDSPLAATVGRVGVYRAQESLSHQVVEAMARSVLRLSSGPFTEAPIDFAISTGDAADNSQLNELESYIALLDGGEKVLPDSGDTTRYEGVGSWQIYDRRYWHPEGTPRGESDDIPRARRGFPIVPGLLDACRMPFATSGLGLPWYAVYGNHDALFGGTLPNTGDLADLAINSVKPIGIDPDIDPLPLLLDNEKSPSPGLWSLLSGPIVEVTPDPLRRSVQRPEWIAAHYRSDGADAHGLDAGTEGCAYYAADFGVVRLLVLDTVNEQGGWQGSLGEEQFSWLENQLIEGSSRFIDRSGRTVANDRPDRLFVLASHHPLQTLINGYSPNGSRRVLLDEVAELLGRFPNVVLWINGHTHVNDVRPVRRDGSEGGFWQLTVASHADWPQQSRVVEIALDGATGDIVIISSMIDHLGLVDGRLGELDDPLTLAGWSRELSANAWQGRVGGLAYGRGDRLDRNVICTLRAPFERVGL